METLSTPQKPKKAATIHNPYKRQTPTATLNPPIVSPQSTKRLIENEIYTQPSIILHLHDSAMDLYTELDSILTALVNGNSNDVTSRGREIILAAVQYYVNQTINLNNNTCGTYLSANQRQLTHNLLTSVLTYVGAPHRQMGADVVDLTESNNTTTRRPTPNKRPRHTHQASDTVRQSPTELQELVQLITEKTYDVIPMGIDTTEVASPCNALRCALWYNNATTEESKATAAASKPITYRHRLEPPVPEVFPTRIDPSLPNGWDCLNVTASINATTTPLKSLFSVSPATLKAATKVNGDHGTIYHHPIVAEMWCPGSQQEKCTHRTFITIHQPSQTIVICDKRLCMDNTYPFIYRYGTILQDAATDEILSKNIGQKIFPAYHARDPFNGNSRTKLALLHAYAIIPPTPPPLIPHIEQQTHTGADGTTTHQTASPAAKKPPPQARRKRGANTTPRRTRNETSGTKALNEILQQLDRGKTVIPAARGSPSQQTNGGTAGPAMNPQAPGPQGNPKDPDNYNYQNDLGADL